MGTTWKILERREEILHKEEVLDEEGNVIMPARDEKTIFTKVEYDFDGIVVVVDVAHFMPQSEDDITLGINNRGVSERRKLEINGDNNNI